MAVIQFNDDGSLVDDKQHKEALKAITEARKDNPNGAVVMVFVHGWHHGAAWSDPHFVGLRNSLMGVTLREAERYGQAGAGGRRVIGVHVAWRGDNPDSFLGAINGNLTFLDRFSTAEEIGEGDAIKGLFRDIIKAAKGPLDSSPPVSDSPLIMMGHSMGHLCWRLPFSNSCVIPNGD